MSSAPKNIATFIDTDFLYQHSPCGHLSFDVAGKIYSVNQTFLQWSGLTKDECLSDDFTSLLTPGGILYYQMVVSSLLHLHGLANEINFTFKSAKGNFDTLFNAVAYRDELGKVIIINATVVRITDRKKYEAELLRAGREAEEERRRMEFLLNALPVMIWTALPNGDINYINQRIKDYFGDLKREELGRFLGIVDEDRESFMDVWTHCLETGEVLDREVRFKKPDGSYEWIVMKIEPYRNQEGEIELWFGSCTSIHNKKMLQLAHHSALTNHLSTAQQTIEQNKNQLNRIAFNQAHLIRKPLANMMGLIPLLKSEPLSSEGLLVLELLLMSANDLDAVITDIVAQTKI